MARPPSFILASASPRRAALLESAGLIFDREESRVSEDPYPGAGPEGFALAQARKKALAVARKRPGRWVLAADTVVAANHELLGKPASEKDAERMLGLLSGRSHRVITGFAIVNEARGEGAGRAVTSQVVFRELSAREIAGYIATGEPFDKAGAYAIQGGAASFVKEVKGSYTNVVGLPLAEVVEELVRLGIARPFEA